MPLPVLIAVAYGVGVFLLARYMMRAKTELALVAGIAGFAFAVAFQVYV